MAQHFLAGVGRALIFKGNNLIGVAKTLTESTFNFSITGEEIRGGQGNALWGKYFHDSNLGVTLTDAMFNLEYIAASLGVDISMGGLSVAEETQQTGEAGGTVTLDNTPVPFDGTLIGWYKLPTQGDDEWSIASISGNVMTIPSAQNNATYCVKYYYQNSNAKSITINTQYVPSELHVTIINDLFSGDVNNLSSATRYGRLITDIPRLQMDGNQDLSLTATSAATVSLTGSALAVNTTDSCEENPYYGTMTEEVFGSVWQNDVIALAVENSEISIPTEGTATLVVRAVYGGSIASQRQDNSNFTFAVEDSPAATATNVQVGTNTGIVTAGATQGTAVISVTLTDYEEPTEYFWNTEATGGIEVGQYLDYAWSGYMDPNEELQIVDPYIDAEMAVQNGITLHDRKAIAGLPRERFGSVAMPWYPLTGPIMNDMSMSSFVNVGMWGMVFPERSKVVVYSDLITSIQGADWEGAMKMVPDLFWGIAFGEGAFEGTYYYQTDLLNTYNGGIPFQYNHLVKDW